ncbi:MAG: uroporphyrinogen-III synthase [Actinobacteria bacterium]|jgi:uroporphyrinogen-III synthase|nr:uroporphyrinogen-III synthase [Actinomycetota bacterium]
MSNSLEGRSVVITRSIAQNESLRRLLEARGARVVEVPLIAVVEPDDEGRERDEVLQRFEDFDWIVVTSPNGADRVAPFLSAAHAAGDAKRFPLLAAVGEATARSVGTPVALCAEPARSDVLAQQFPEGSGSVLVVQGNLADNQLSDDIEAKGWTVTRVVAYRTVHLRPTKEMMLPALSADVLLLASGSAATAWFDAFGASTPPYVVAMGPSTAKVAVNLGLEVSAIASEQTLDSLIETAERVISQ